MATKTDRILSYLPPTFRALPRPTGLFAVVDSAGEQLLQAENSLGAVMLSHWVDHADRGAEFIADLACFAALYGLAPRGAVKDVARFQTPTCLPVSADETIEEFREHLKRYVLTFLDGTVTVQGILRIVAEALGIHIADKYADMQTWWTPGNDPFVTVEHRTDDAAGLLFGPLPLVAHGSAALRAQVSGGIFKATESIDLQGRSKLRIKIDDGAPVDVDLAASGRLQTLAQVVANINRKFPQPIASNPQLLLASPTIGERSRLELIDVDNDAAQLLLFLSPRTFRGAAASAASVVGSTPIPKIDLSERRYLRLLIDRKHLAEIDCAGPDPRATTLPQITSAINQALGFKVASAEGPFLRLTSPTKGPGSSIDLEAAAAQDARQILLSDATGLWRGEPVRAASIEVDIPDFGGGVVDLSAGSSLFLAVDARPPVSVDCAGADPSATSPDEIAAAINKAFGTKIAFVLQRFESTILRLMSPTIGPSSRISFLPLRDNDAAYPLFGIGPRAFFGADGAPARLIGIPDLSQGVNVGAQHRLLVSVDGHRPLPVDLWSASGNRQSVSLSQLRSVFDSALPGAIAADDGKHLILESQTIGPGSSIAVLPVEETRTRRFVTRAFITDDPVTQLFGPLPLKSSGKEPVPAVLQGNADLSRGVDLRQKRYLLVSVDEGSLPTQVDCARGARIPRSATLDEIVTAINTQLAAPVASHDGHHLTMTSPATGGSALVAVKDPLPISGLLGLDTREVHGRDGTAIFCEGTRDLSAGVDLSHADRIVLGVTGGDSIEIAIVGADPAHITLNEIVESINFSLGAQVATAHDKHTAITAAPGHTRARLEFRAPPSRDATEIIFGFRPPRIYLGDPGSNAVLKGTKDLSKGVDLTSVASRPFPISVDGRPKAAIDCARRAADPEHVQIDEIVQAINQALGQPVASADGGFLVLTSPRSGEAASILVESGLPPESASAILLNLPDITSRPIVGRDALPAAIQGQTLPPAGIDLAGAGPLRIVIDGGMPIDIDVAGEQPEQTALFELVDRINAVVPNVAALRPFGPKGDEQRLVLTSPSAGSSSSIDVLPRRALELIDYPPVPVQEPEHQVHHGGRFVADNDGAADTVLQLQVTAPQGDAGMEFVDRAAGTRVRVISVLRPGDKLAIEECGDHVLQAVITEPDGNIRVVPDSDILVGTLGAEAMVPFHGEWLLARGAGGDEPPLLQLNDPTAPAIVVLRGLEPLLPNDRILATVNPAKDAAATPAAERLFDVTVRLITSRPTLTETYPSVTIGRGPSSDSLILKILASSRIVTAEEIFKSGVLKLARGSSEFTYMDCHEARFNHAWFPASPDSGALAPPPIDETRFAGGPCREFAVFDISRFSNDPPERESAYFAPLEPLPDPPVEASVAWTRYQPGAFAVNLPADLDEEFGSRFDQDRFGLPNGKPELYNGVITEPDTDRDYIVKRINAKSTLVTATAIPKGGPPPGFEVFQMPFLHPRSHTLSGGTATQPARLFVAENGVPGIIELRARDKGAWANTIAVTSRQAGPVRFDMSIGYVGVRFESARLVALAGRILKPREDPLAQLTAQILKPGPVGVLQAKAAGVLANVTRDHTETPPDDHSCRANQTGITQIQTGITRRRKYNGK
jgi:hypothetical protein